MMSGDIKKKLVYIILLIFVQLAVYSSGNSESLAILKQKKINVLSIFTSKWMGGAEMCALTMHKLLHQASYKTYMLIYKDSPLQKYLQDDQLPYYAMSSIDKKNERELCITRQINSICRKHKIQLVQCHTPAIAQLARSATKGLHIKVVLMYHGVDAVDFLKFKKLDGLITVNPSNESLIREANDQLKLGIKKITQMYPFFNEERFLRFKPRQMDKQDFFKRHGFNILDKNTPILCMVANFYGKLKNPCGNYISRKNQELLIRALCALLYERKKPAYLVFLGDGADRAWYEQLTKDLGVSEFVFFAGFCKEVEEFLYHTDIHVLTSVFEPLGIVYLEAGLMKKPSVGACGTGADHTIIDGTTGFTFKNNDLSDLTDKLDILIDDSKLRMKMGQHAFEFVTGRASFNSNKRAFLSKRKFEKLTSFYASLMN